MRILILVLSALFISACTTGNLKERKNDLYVVKLPSKNSKLQMNIPVKQFPYALEEPVQLWERRANPKRLYRQMLKYYEPVMVVPYGSNYLFLLQDGMTLMSLEFHRHIETKNWMGKLTLLGSASSSKDFSLQQWKGQGARRSLTPQEINSMSFQFESFINEHERSL